MRSSILFISLTSIFSFTYAIVSSCLNDGEMALTFDGGPSTDTPRLLSLLKKENLTALFHLDSEKLAMGGVSVLISSIIRDNHILGLSLSQSLDLNAMSSDSLRATLSNRASAFFAAVGKWPMFIKVPADLPEEQQKAIESSGYLIPRPFLDLSKVWAGNCEPRFDATIGKSIIAQSSSLILSVADTETGCSVDEVKRMIEVGRQNGFQFVRMDKCINLQNPYKKNPSEIADVQISFLSFGQSDVQTTSTDVHKLSAASSAGRINAVEHVHLLLLALILPLIL